MAYTEATHEAKGELLTAMNQCDDINEILAPEGTLPTTGTDTELKAIAEQIAALRNNQTDSAFDTDVSAAIATAIVAFCTDLKSALDAIKTTKSGSFVEPVA